MKDTKVADLVRQETEYKKVLRMVKTSFDNKEIKQYIKNSSYGFKEKNKLALKYFWYRKIRYKRTEGNIRRTLSTYSAEKIRVLTQQMKCQSPLVSVIVPNYNHSAYLTQRIESILNQKFQDFELILLDDHSPDNSKEILMQYKNNPKVSHIVINEENTGNTFWQWEKGISLSRGKFIWIAESDDYAAPDFLSSILPHLLINPEASFGYTGSHWVDAKGFVLPMGLDLWTDTGKVHYYQGRKFARHNLLYFNGVYNASMVVFRKSAFQAIDKTFTHMRCAGDWLCWFEMALQGKVIEVQRKLNYFRQHENKVTSHATRTYGGITDAITIGRILCQKLKLSIYKQEMMRGYLYKHIHEAARNKEDKQFLLDKLKKEMGGTKRSYTLFKINKYLYKRMFLSFLSFPAGDKLNHTSITYSY